MNAAAALANVVTDLRAEGDALHAQLLDMDTGYWTQQTGFKKWTVWDVVAHLHFSDHLAFTSLTSANDFRALQADMGQGSLRTVTERWLEREHGHTLNGPKLLEAWRSLFLALCDALAAAHPDERFAWFGPGMKARMFATARQMETWAHGWEIYDLLGVARTHTDRIRNIAEIGVRTFGWTFTNRRLPVPEPVPRVTLTAPSGARWVWHEETTGQSVTGSAVEFCQVVTQVRHVDDTALEIEGDGAAAWMQIAQCFAGRPEDPPAPGTRGPGAR